MVRKQFKGGENSRKYRKYSSISYVPAGRSPRLAVILELAKRLVEIPVPRLEHIMLFFLPIILFRNSSYFNLLFPYYHPIILMNLFKEIESVYKIIDDVTQF